jgi:hypothetical protein
MAFRPHYFILMLPAIAILAGVAVSRATTSLNAVTEKRSLRCVPCTLFVIALVACFYHQRAFFLETDPIAASHAIYFGDPFPEAVTISDYIRQHTPENARVAVLGSEPEIYFYAHRHSATGYIYTYGLMENQKYALQMQQQMIGEIEAARPEVLVFVNLYGSWSPTSRSQQLIYQWARKYINDHYEVSKVVGITLPDTDYHWSKGVKSYAANSSVYVFKRKIS